MKIIILYILFFITLASQAQQQVTGVVREVDEKGEFQPLEGVMVYWLKSTVGTETDSLGKFKIPYDSTMTKLVLSYIGYISDTVLIKQEGDYSYVLKMNKNELKEFIVQGKRDATQIDFNSTYNLKVMTEKELFKAACCNLSESFETNPSVDVNYSDAVTGAKQIQMLGLSGIYTQLTSENLPGTRGLASNFGLSYIPGTWIESIQVAKGIGSVVNGYESVTGQINVELKKTETSEKVYLNGYVNSMLRSEGNLILSTKISKKVSTSLLTHADLWGQKIDANKDGFLDMPLSNQYSFVNRWKYMGTKGLEAQAGVKVLADNRTGGEVNFNEKTDKLTITSYGLGIKTNRYEGFTKIGYVWQDKPYRSIGVIADVLHHETDNYFGLNKYIGLQQSIYTNLIYHSIIKNTNHKFKTGISYLYDVYDEKVNANEYKRFESVVGTFMEYTFTPNVNWNIVSGARVDYNSLFGWIVTPRLHAKYNVTENTTLRFAGGRGQRTANIFAENMAYFASSRQTVIVPSVNGKAYGLNPEVAWNYGLNFLHEFKINQRKVNINLDYYRTDFVNQVVVDLDANPQAVRYENLKGVSFSNSFQGELNYELIKRLDLRLAYRLYDVKTTYSGALLDRYLISKHRAFVNIGYATKNKWSFDYTINWNGPKRIPSTQSNPEEYRMNNYSPSFITMNAQISKKIKKAFEAYLGVENLTDFRQKNLILASNTPFGPYFDSSLVWGPVLGRMVYLGFRLKIK